MQVIFTLWDDSPIVIETDMIVDYRANWSDNEKCTIQTVRDSWPVKESFEEIIKAFHAIGIRPRQIKLLIAERKAEESKKKRDAAMKQARESRVVTKERF